MATKLLIVDTNIIIDYLKNKPVVLAFVNNHGKENIALCPIVVMEIIQGVLNKSDLQSTLKKLDGFASLELNQTIVEVAIQLQKDFLLSHHLSIPDSVVAATSLVYALELRTYNLKDFRFIPQIAVSNSLQ